MLYLMADWLYFALIFGGMLMGMQGERWRAAWARREWRAKRGQWWKAGRNKPGTAPLREVSAAAPPAFDAAEQLRCVMAAPFAKRPLLNRPETRVLAAAERAVHEIDAGWRVMAQVSLGEILVSPDAAAYRAINSKRVDMLIITGAGEPLAAIEYQGKGHHQGSAAARDAVKKEALRRAGIDYIEIKAGDRTTDLNWAIGRLAAGVGRPAA